MNLEAKVQETGLAERIAAALEPVVRPLYGPPHVYPICVPAFVARPCEEREHPQHPFLRLYAHIPFCNYACNFCFYAKRVGASRAQMERYVAALRRELEWAPAGTPLSQLFVGGGTPTALPADLLDEVLDAIFERLPPLAGYVHTVEGSPESITPEHLRVLRARGVGRISMGIQSLSDSVLEEVRRDHGSDEALAMCERLVDEGFILSVDLIYGLPGQSEASFRRDLEAVVARGVHSVTLYDLRINEQTPVVRSLAEDEHLGLARLLRWRAFVKQAAESLGLTQVRWHTFKRLDGPAARHERAPCFDEEVKGYQLGIGMSARSHLGHTIYRNHRDLNTYVRRIEAGESPVEEVFRLGPKERKTNFIARSLGDGKLLDARAWERAFGNTLEDEFGDTLGRLADADLIEAREGAIEMSDTGKLVHDLVTLAFYPPEARRWLREREQAARARYRRAS